MLVQLHYNCFKCNNSTDVSRRLTLNNGSYQGRKGLYIYIAQNVEETLAKVFTIIQTIT